MTEINDNKRRTIRMSDFMWETLADLAHHNGRTIGEEIRAICHEALTLAGYEFDEERAQRASVGLFRKVEAA